MGDRVEWGGYHVFGKGALDLFGAGTEESFEIGFDQTERFEAEFELVVFVCERHGYIVKRRRIVFGFDGWVAVHFDLKSFDDGDDGSDEVELDDGAP